MNPASKKPLGRSNQTRDLAARKASSRRKSRVAAQVGADVMARAGKCGGCPPLHSFAAWAAAAVG